jgi:sugar phosphate isomerase/epimerase
MGIFPIFPRNTASRYYAMRNLIDRRDFLRTAGALGAGIGMTGLGASGLLAAPLAKGAPNAEKLGWRLGCQAYSFNRFTFSEAVEKVASLGLHYVEMYPGQKLAPKTPKITTGESLSPEVRKRLKGRLRRAGVKLVCYGVCGLSKDEAASRKTFQFARDMGIETIVSEPPSDAFDTIEKLCEEYSINVALHNHPKPSRYWDPDIVLKACKGRSKRIGACADTGHWMRSELNPVECIKKLEGRIISFHFKDLNKYGRGAHDVPWGTGEGNVKGMLTEIRRQGFQGVFSIEYEHNWLKSLPEIAESVRYFDKVAAELAGKKS